MVAARLASVSVELAVPSVMAWLAPSEPTTVSVPPSKSELAAVVKVPISPVPLVPVPTPTAEISIPVLLAPPPVALAAVAAATAALPACPAVVKAAVRPRPALLMALIKPCAVFE